ncbi:hypothetical protein [Sharpea azabuensis]|uniref:Uncharacterized protein n=1 Tax=Sharpea azabuensis TaxID=322505 RepID=A0A1H6TRX8_9FIRM|nr:hypothetical protein [Sharpea azabuensis]MDD6512998.1 hypothetical protein [Sharpea azabuensis]SEI78965.1 hypothetical protein SAMN04487834_102420 [Sharpea azabuensis]SFE07147.1 hypothetical protein SAMN04487836_12224 [Sharpea azabuensis]SFK97517.1 hypothetical protein SAMN04487835_12213 [Sharpea azabuensis]
MRINYADALVELLNRELKDNKHTLDEFIDAYRLHNEDIILVTLSKDMKYNPETRQFE